LFLRKKGVLSGDKILRPPFLPPPGGKTPGPPEVGGKNPPVWGYKMFFLPIPLKKGVPKDC